MMLQRFMLVVFLVAESVGVGGAASVREGEAGSMLVSPRELKDAGLQVGWQINLPLKETETVERLFIFDKYLYVLSDWNYLFCIDRSKGRIRFCMELAGPGVKLYEPQYYDGRLLFTVGARIFILDPSAGAVKESRRLVNIGRGAVCGARRNAGHIFVAGLDKRLHAIVADEYWEEFGITADNDSLINSIVLDEDFLLFSTSVGNVVKCSSQKAKKLWQRDIPGRIDAPIVREGGWLYVGSENTKLYKLDIETGQSGWETAFQAGERLTASATVGRSAVYQYAGNNGLYAIDKESGKMLWQESEGLGLLSEKDERAYVLARPGVLVVMDNETGGKLYSVNFTGVSRFATNRSGSTIYVADDRGRVMNINEKQ